MSQQDPGRYFQRVIDRRVGRRRLLRSVAVGGSGVLAFAAACGTGGTKPSSTSKTAPGASGSAVAEGPPKTGGYLRQTTPYSAGNIDPHTTDQQIGYNFIEDDWYEPLVNLDYGNGTVDWRIAMKVIPWLAGTIERPDPTTYLFSIRQGVKWHNGDPFTADDVLFSYKRMLSPDAGITPYIQGFIRHVDSVQQPDDHSIRLTSKAPDADFPIYLAQRALVIVPAKILQSGGSLSKQAIGTGPFRLSSYTKDGSALATRYEGYWQQGHPYLDGIRITLHVDDAGMSAAFAAGGTDIITRTDRKEAEPLMQADPKALVRHFLEEEIQGITFNETRPPFNDPRVRRAVHVAIDRQEAVKAVYFGEGQISGPVVVVGKTGWHIPTDELLKTPGYRQPKDQDIAQAKQLLAAAGYPNGFKSSISFDQPFAVVPQVSEVVQSQLKKIGVDAALAPLDNPTYVSHRVKGDYDMLTISEGSMALPANVVNIVFYSKGIYGKPAGINDAELDKLIEAQAVEFDATKRGQIFQQIERRILDQVHKAPIGTPTVYVLQQPWVHDWVDNRSSRQTVMNPTTVWLDVSQAPANRRQSS